MVYVLICCLIHPYIPGESMGELIPSENNQVLSLWVSDGTMEVLIQISLLQPEASINALICFYIIYAIVKLFNYAAFQSLKFTNSSFVSLLPHNCIINIATKLTFVSCDALCT